MKFPLILLGRKFAVVFASLAALPVAVLAQDLTPPYVVNPVADLTVTSGTAQSVINLKKTFQLTGVTGQIVRMATTLGDIDIEMLNDETPLNVENFLSYVTNGEYNKTFIHRSVPGFILQGGGYYIDSTGAPSMIAQHPAVVGEHRRSNTRGTLALALSTGPDSGTSEWFFNLADNTMLDTSVGDPNYDGGPFTVFGRVIEADMTTVDAIAAVNVPHPAALKNGPYYEIPLLHYDDSKGVQLTDLIYLNDVVVVPLVPPSVGADSVLTLKVKNNNPALLTATITGKKLKLFYNAGQTGTAKIKVFATDSAGTRTKSQFHVTVQ